MIKRKIVQVFFIGTFLLSGCAVPLLESPAPMEPGEIDIGIYSDALFGGGLYPTGIMLKAGLTKNISLSARAAIYGAGLDIKRSFGNRAVALGFNSFLFSAGSNSPMYGWTWIHLTGIIGSRKNSSTNNSLLRNMDISLLIGPYAYVNTINTESHVPWGLRMAMGLAIGKQSPVKVLTEYGFLIPLSGTPFPYDDNSNSYDYYMMPYGSLGIFFGF